MTTRLRALTALASIPFLITTVYAQRDRVAARIDRTQRVVLRGYTPRQAQSQFDQGRVDATFQMPAMVLHLKASDTQASDLAQLLADQQNPTSPNFHKWLTPEQYADRFGVSQADIDRITAWLTAQGFTVQATARSPDLDLFQWYSRTNL